LRQLPELSRRGGSFSNCRWAYPEPSLRRGMEMNVIKQKAGNKVTLHTRSNSKLETISKIGVAVEL